MFSGKIYTAQEMYDLGLVHVLAEPGEGEAAGAPLYPAEPAPDERPPRRLFAPRSRSIRSRSRNCRRSWRIWADTGLNLSDQQLKVMRRFAVKQVR